MIILHARKIHSRILHYDCPKYIFPNFGGTCPPVPVFYTCDHCRQCEVENEYTSKKLVLSAILVPKSFTIGRNLAKF